MWAGGVGSSRKQSILEICSQESENKADRHIRKVAGEVWDPVVPQKSLSDKLQYWDTWYAKRMEGGGCRGMLGPEGCA